MSPYKLSTIFLFSLPPFCLGFCFATAPVLSADS